MLMEKKVTKTAKDVSADFCIADYIGDAPKRNDTPKSQGQSVETDKQTKVDVSEQSAQSIQSTQPGEQTEQNDNPMLIPAKKTVSTKQRKNSLVEYQETFLKVPKITDRKNVFISNSTRELIVGIVRRLGGKRRACRASLKT
ncbi:hypothetical protein AGMMS49574_01760 [Bacteroidia bacterium]|nr:hypothetical protein AGMMS49574_01760 [Bacteroidia bacterium]